MRELEACKAETLKELEYLNDMESFPFTLNTHYYRDYKQKFLAYFRSIRGREDSNNVASKLGDLSRSVASGNRRGDDFETYSRQALSNLAALGITGLNATDLIKLLPPHPESHEAAFNIMAAVRAYYQVAYKRFTDNVPLAIDRHFIRAFERRIETALFTGLGIGQPNAKERCTNWLKEPESVVTRRADLLDKKSRLEVARTELLEVGL